MSKKEFVNGFRVSRKQNAPSFVIANIGIKVDDFKNWLFKVQQGDWVNIDIKLSKEGNYYAELNSWTPEQGKTQEYKKDEVEENQERLNNLDTKEEIEYPEDETINIEDIPF